MFLGQVRGKERFLICSKGNMRPLKNGSRFRVSQDQVEDPGLCAGEGDQVRPKMT